MRELRDRLRKAKRPIVIVGGGGWNATAVHNVQSFAERNHCGLSGFPVPEPDNTHDNYVGDVGIGINQS